MLDDEWQVSLEGLLADKPRRLMMARQALSNVVKKRMMRLGSEGFDSLLIEVLDGRRN